MSAAFDDLELPEMRRAVAALEARGVCWRTLAAGRARASDPVALVATLLRRRAADGAVAAAADAGVAAVLEAIEVAFPENLLWDVDRLIAELLAREDAEALSSATAQVVRLQQGFGRQGPISFRYAHDFLYGFDWARWVKRAPEERAAEKPFGDAMLNYLERRMHELVDLIREDDAKYRQLDAGEPWRNPFGFSREPADEERLFRDLAQSGALPVEAWSAQGRVDWQRTYGALRRDAAARLGIANE